MLVILISATVYLAGAVRKYEKQQYEQRLKSVYRNNCDYRELLDMAGECTVSADGVEYIDEKIDDYAQVYRKIAIIRVFNPESTFDYDDASELFAEYDMFCRTGNESELLDKFGSDYKRANQRAWNKEGISDYNIVDHIYFIQLGHLHISNNEGVFTKIPDFDEEYLQLVDSLNGNEELAAGMYYERYSDIFILWEKKR